MSKYNVLNVYFPDSGIFYILRWYTHNEGHQLLIGRTERVLKKLIFSLCERYKAFSLKEGYKIELVAPSNSMYEKAAQKDKEDRIKYFLVDVINELRIALDAGINLPSVFEKCTKFSWQEGYNGKIGPYELKYHFECKNCINGFNLVGISKDQLYERYHEIFNNYLMEYNPYLKSKLNNDYAPKYIALPSKARQISDNEEIWAAIPNFGHHSSGVDLEIITPKDEINNVDVLFYFKKKLKLKLYKYDQIILDFREKEKFELEQAKKIADENKAQKAKDKAKRLIDIFSNE